MFIDLDCRFDVLSLSASLKHRILKANGKSMQCLKESDAEYDKELFAESMRRFLCIRCYDSIQFLATLKYWSFSLDGSCFCIYAAREQQQSFVSHRMLVRPSDNVSRSVLAATNRQSELLVFLLSDFLLLWHFSPSWLHL